MRMNVTALLIVTCVRTRHDSGILRTGEDKDAVIAHVRRWVDITTRRVLVGFGDEVGDTDLRRQ